jgi:hypothetical protein
MSVATDGELIALGERFQKLFLEYMDAWLAWAPRMRAALAEARDNTAALAVAIQRNSFRDLDQPLRALRDLGGTSGPRLPCGRV